MTMSISDLLNRAKLSIGAGEDHLHQAAEDIAVASEQGATQRKIAETVGKSAAWVNGLLKWRLAGYPATAFGPQRAASRAAFRPSEQRKSEEAERPASTREQAQRDAAKLQADEAKADAAAAKARAQQAKADAATARADASRARADARKARDDMFSDLMGRNRKKRKIHSGPRELLVKSLGMLGSDHAGERDAAACTVERLRKKLDMDWDQLIVEAS